MEGGGRGVVLQSSKNIFLSSACLPVQSTIYNFAFAGPRAQMLEGNGRGIVELEFISSPSKPQSSFTNGVETISTTVKPKRVKTQTSQSSKMKVINAEKSAFCSAPITTLCNKTKSNESQKPKSKTKLNKRRRVVSSDESENFDFGTDDEKNSIKTRESNESVSDDEKDSTKRILSNKSVNGVDDDDAITIDSTDDELCTSQEGPVRLDDDTSDHVPTGDDDASDHVPTGDDAHFDLGFDSDSDSS